MAEPDSTLLSIAEEAKRYYLVQEEWRRANAADFNVFMALGVAYRELSHSRFLAELLNPIGSHGQGELFLDAFLTLIGIPATRMKLREVLVTVEHHVGDPGRLDILLRLGGRQLIIIENKIDAAEQSAQVERYQGVLDEAGTQGCVVFLTRTGRTAESGDHSRTVTLSYSQLAEMIECLIDRVRPSNLSVVLGQYARLCREIGGSSKMPSSYDPQIKEFVARPENLRALLDLTPLVQRAKHEAIERFIDRVVVAASAELHSCPKWTVKRLPDREEAFMSVGIVPNRSAPNDCPFPLLLAKEKNTPDSPVFVGVPSSIPGAFPEGLQSALKKAGLAKGNPGWPGWNLIVRLPEGFPPNYACPPAIDAMLAEEIRPHDGNGLSQRLGRELARIFLDCRPALEVANGVT